MTEAILLDPVTLLFVTAIVVAFTGALLMIAGGGRADARMMRVWGLAMASGAAGLVLVALGRSSRLADLAGNTLILSAPALSWAAARMFVERPRQAVVTCTGPLLWLGMAMTGLGQQGMLAMACGIGAAYTAGSAFELWRGRRDAIASSGTAMVLLAAHATIYAFRMVDAAASLTPPEWAPRIMAGLLLESLLHTVGMGFLLLAMVKDKLELRSGEQLRRFALQDGLTGVANRRHLEERLDAEFKLASRMRSPLALLLIDVDHFKMFNDTYGHPWGDACLREVAHAVQAFARRPPDLLARYGGEEFAVLLPHTDLTGASQIAESIRAAVQGLAIEHPSPPGVVTVSVGAVSMVPGRGVDDAKTLVEIADRALYAAKAGGRNVVHAARNRPMLAA